MCGSKSNNHFNVSYFQVLLDNYKIPPRSAGDMSIVYVSSGSLITLRLRIAHTSKLGRQEMLYIFETALTYKSLN